MFRSPESRTLLRATVAGLMLLLGGLVAGADDNSLSMAEILGALSAGVTGFAGWYGIGAVSPTEPYLGVGNPDVVQVPGEPPTVVEPGAEG